MSLASLYPWLCEVHDVKSILAVFTSIFDTEIEPLLVAFRIGVDLHVHVIFTSVYAIRLQ